MGQSAITISQRLRRETADAHLRIEQAIALERDDFSLPDLRSLMIGFYGFHRTWEPAVASLLASDGPWFEPRRKLSALQSDLRALQIDPHDPSLPVCQRLPQLADRFHAMGSMYVMEGSTLGGQLVGRFLSSRLSLRDGHGYSYFVSYGNNVGSMWRLFTDRLNAEVVDACSPHADHVVAAANQTFAYLADWLVSVRNDRSTVLEKAS